MRSILSWWHADFDEALEPWSCSTFYNYYFWGSNLQSAISPTPGSPVLCTGHWKLFSPSRVSDTSQCLDFGMLLLKGGSKNYWFILSWNILFNFLPLGWKSTTISVFRHTPYVLKMKSKILVMSKKVLKSMLKIFMMFSSDGGGTNKQDSDGKNKFENIFWCLFWDILKGDVSITVRDPLQTQLNWPEC